MNTFARRCALALLLACGFGAAHAQVVISQVYGGAGCGTAGCSTYKNDYVELFNRGASPVSVDGWSVQYSSATGTAWQATSLPNVSIPAGGYLLVAQAFGANGVNSLPAPDAAGTIAMSGTAGKVALVNTTIALSGTCPAGGGIQDLIGYGATASCNEGGANAPAPSTTLADFRAMAGCTDSGNNGTDFSTATPAARNSATALAPCGGGGQASLSISNTSAAEGDSGSTAFMFTISLNQAAGAGGVSVDYATADDSATAGSDYTAKTGTATILEGNTSVTISVDVNGDTTTEANETFFVNLSNPTAGATISDAQGIGTINNDDVVLTAIHDIQGNGASSPLVGGTLYTRGIVTGRKSNGFFIQAADADADADPATSEGVFVFTSSMPSGVAAVGNLVQVFGTVAEFVPSQDPLQAPLTELVGTPTAPMTVTLLSGGHPLPTAAVLTTTLPDAAGALGQLEPFEGMRVTAPSFTVVAPTKGNTNEPNATGTSNGLFNVVVTGVARPFREPGIQVPDPDPSGSTATAIPRWDFNPELITVDSDALGGTQLNLPSGTVLTNLVGPLDFGFRRYTILAEAGTTVGVAGGLAPTAARLPTGDEFTVASYNLERFFDTVNDPAVGEPVLTSTAFANRLNKASLAIRGFLNTPDIVGVVEVENLSTLQALATKINDDAVAASQPNPQYTAHLMEGNDVGGIDVGFLVKSGEVGAGIPRVEFEDLLQLGKDQTWLDPSDNTQKLLNDRPPLLLQAIIHFADGRKFPLTAIVVHQRSLNGSTSELPDGVVTEGFRVRAKRQAQAEYLANQIQLRQDTSDPAERIVVVGDFNAFEFNDGLGDSMNVVEGTPTADNETAVDGDGADLVDPDLVNLAVLEPATERYSFVFDGNAQSLDHVLINELLAIDAGFDLDHARINADFPETNRNDANSPSRLSDHDPAVAYFSVGSANLATTASATPGTVNVGDTMTFDAGVTNNGPDTAESVGVGFAFDEEIPDLYVDFAPIGWTCDTPTVGSGTTTVSCHKASVANAAVEPFRLIGHAPASALGSTINLAVLAIAGTPDPDETDNDAAASVDVVPASADLQVAISGPTRTATHASYTISVTNAGPNSVPTATLDIDTNIPEGAVTGPFIGPMPWSCSPPLGTSFRRTCDYASGIEFPSGSTYSFVVQVRRAYDKSSYSIRGTVSSPDPDPDSANNVARRRLSMPQP